MHRGNFEGGRAAHCKVQGHSTVGCVKTADPIEMTFAMLIQVHRRNDVLDVGAHWHLLANAIEPSMWSGDAAFCQITLTTCYYYYYYPTMQ